MDTWKVNYENLHKYFCDILADSNKEEIIELRNDDHLKSTEDLQSVIYKIVDLSKCSNICFSESTLFMLLLDIVKFVCELIIDITDASVLKRFFTNIFRDVSDLFVASLIECKISEHCVQYKIAEVLSYFISASCIVSRSSEYYQNLHIHLSRSKTCSPLIHLCTIEQLCEFDEKFSNLSFINSLFRYTEFYFERFFPSCLFGGSRQEQIFALRIYHRCLTTSDDNRIILFQHLKYIADKQDLILSDPVLCVKYLQFLKALFPFPAELDGSTSVIGPIAEQMVSKLIATIHIIPKCNRYFGGMDMRNSHGHSTVVCGIVILFFKCACCISNLPFTTERKMLVDNVWYCILNLVTGKRDSQAVAVISEKLIEAFLEQDDDLIDMMLLHLHFSCSYLKLMSIQLKNPDPHQLFLTLMKHLSFNSSIVLDWLTSDETRFLQYFVKYLKFLASSWNDFLKASSEMDLNEKDYSNPKEFVKYSLQSRNCLKDVTQSIKRLQGAGLFPYSAKPLLRLLEDCGQLFLALK